MTDGFLPPEFARLMEKSYRRMLGLPPDTRTDEERARDRAAFEEASRKIQNEVLTKHGVTIAEAQGLARAILELHGPTFDGPTDRWARCAGCDFSGSEAESPDFPCPTYQLVAAWRESETA